MSSHKTKTEIEVKHIFDQATRIVREAPIGLYLSGKPMCISIALINQKLLNSEYDEQILVWELSDGYTNTIVQEAKSVLYNIKEFTRNASYSPKEYVTHGR